MHVEVRRKRHSTQRQEGDLTPFPLYLFILSFWAPVLSGLTKFPAGDVPTADRKEFGSTWNRIRQMDGIPRDLLTTCKAATGTNET
jgi:hypothetical protein